jgi:hypothetical protein
LLGVASEVRLGVGVIVGLGVGFTVGFLVGSTGEVVDSPGEFVSQQSRKCPFMVGQQ